MIVAAAEAGARGIYCEKPFCRTPAEADEIVAACEQSGTKLALAHRNRYHPALPQVLAAVKGGAIGQLLEIRGRGKEDARGGGLDLWVLGSHVLDLTRYFAGNAVACSATMFDGTRPVTPADVVAGAEGVGPLAGNRLHARYEMESGIPAYFDSICDAGVGEVNFGLQLIGNQGIIDLRVDLEPLAHYVVGNPFLPAESRRWVPITSAGIDQPERIADIRHQVADHVLPARDLIRPPTPLQRHRRPRNHRNDPRRIRLARTERRASYAAAGITRTCVRDLEGDIA
jgi:predicted dehydrogenase